MIEIGAKFDDGWQFDGVCKKCKENISHCQCKKEQEVLSAKEHNKISVQIEKRKNKKVTVAKEFFLEPKEAKDLMKSLKKSLGVGGTIKENSIELQGDVVQKLKQALASYGFKV